MSSYYEMMTETIPLIQSERKRKLEQIEKTFNEFSFSVLNPNSSDYDQDLIKNVNSYIHEMKEILEENHND